MWGSVLGGRRNAKSTKNGNVAAEEPQTKTPEPRKPAVPKLSSSIKTKVNELLL